MTDLLTTLLQKLDEPAARFAELERYYNGTQPLAFLAPEAKEALGDRFGRMATNLPRLAVTSLSERLRVTGFQGIEVWDDWLRNDLDQEAGIAHREALLLGASYVIVWADAFGRPKVTVESAKQVTVLTDPGTHRITAALKRWETDKTTEAVMYGPQEIVRLSAPQTGATTQGFKVVETIPNPLGVVPVVRLRNADRILDDGVSEIDDLMPLIDALNKVLVDMMTTSEYVGRPRRWATGIELEEADALDDDGEPTGETIAVNPIPEGNRAMISENDAAKFGQLEAAQLGGYETAVKVILGQIMAVSALPAHYVGVFTDNPASADALRAAEASLTARAQARQQSFGRAWEDVARLVLGVRDGADPLRVDCRVTWADAATRSIAQEADAITKLYSIGLLPQSFALRKLGYTDDEITEIRTAKRAEALDATAVDLSKLVG
ncbi:MAG TPA: phage portal protein [Gordonia sp. (in: high G+C Gram-positive bacteria)]|uniref:phage portal protein n=1 Tax=unclassified Gordonia (in: high G+C Gram-positive bacteria) TaxID=2657482 RepID=UPI000FC01184|nr:MULTISPECIES: phage portal protein [unclassified Gordonia (in: high G+C Gram-positive bacteria)]RTL09681.1 MAG: phage portal protein [Acidimicrobiia bacterium]HNP58458.1 phage portal protein [Gordonia sp. (in: high G+C Gram-positive bacteria)]HRC51702.1 phage portal protein [Gordonia sp. (in: high G+C Gram-positive bacteria)]